MGRQNRFPIDDKLVSKIRHYFKMLKDNNKIKGIRDIGYSVKRATSGTIYIKVYHLQNKDIRPKTLRISDHHTYSNIKDQYTVTKGSVRWDYLKKRMSNMVKQVVRASHYMTVYNIGGGEE